MEKSESIKNIGGALLKFASEMGTISKTSTNRFFKSQYADLPTILDAISEPMQNAGLVLTSFPDGDGVSCILTHPVSGEWMQSHSNMKPVKQDPQAIGSAITYQRRYSIASILNLNIDKDDDGNNASEPVKKEIAKKTNPPQKTLLTPESANWKNAIEYLRKEGSTIEMIKTKYILSTENEEKLKEESL